MDKINFQDGTKVSSAKVTIDEVDYTVTPARYSGATPLSASVLNKLQDNIEDGLDELDTKIDSEVDILDAKIDSEVDILDAKIDAINFIDLEVVQTLPTTDIKTKTLYLVPKSLSEQGDVYDEYLYINSTWEHIGSTEADLSNYYNRTEVDTKIDSLNELLNSKVDKVTGQGLSANNFTDGYKTKLDGIATGATKNTVENSLTSTSTTNALSAAQGKALNDKITNLSTYSTSEINTGKKWIDGKYIYKKTIAITFPNDTTTNIAHRISTINTLIDTECTWYDTSDARFFTVPFRYDSSTVYIKINANKTNIIIEGKGTNWSSRTSNGYVTLYYTKT